MSDVLTLVLLMISVRLETVKDFAKLVKSGVERCPTQSCLFREAMEPIGQGAALRIFQVSFREYLVQLLCPKSSIDATSKPIDHLCQRLDIQMDICSLL